MAEKETRNGVIDYRGVMSANREIFLLNFREEFFAFTDTYDRLNSISGVVSTTRARAGHSHVSHLSWLMIIGRQFLNSFECMSTSRSYDAWVLLRPALESALVMGKWIDDRINSDIWENRDNDKKSYMDTYEGKALLSKSLPDSSGVRSVLCRVNDDFMHSNPRYYFRHTKMNVNPHGVVLGLLFTDDGVEHEAHLFAYLHFTRFLVHCIGRMFEAEFGDLPALKADLAGFQSRFKERVVRFAHDNPMSVPVLTEFGLWPNSFFVAPTGS